VTVVRRNNLPWIVAECVGIEWDGIIKNADAAPNQGRAVFTRYPGNPCTWRSAVGISERLGLPPYSGIYGQMGSDRPMILSVCRKLKVGKTEDPIAGIGDIAQ
jgi:hypothetical protein